jgi:phosphoenolpyruvate carboxykinase (GTP)
MAREHPNEMPRIFLVNWFRKDAGGRFLWPGFGENSRVLEWVFRRCEGTAEVAETAFGLVPAEGELNVDGLDLTEDDVRELLHVDTELLAQQMPQVEEHLARFGDELPQEIRAQLEAQKERLG